MPGPFDGGRGRALFQMWGWAVPGETSSDMDDDDDDHDYHVFDDDNDNDCDYDEDGNDDDDEVGDVEQSKSYQVLREGKR